MGFCARSPIPTGYACTFGPRRGEFLTPRAHDPQPIPIFERAWAAVPGSFRFPLRFVLEFLEARGDSFASLHRRSPPRKPHAIPIFSESAPFRGNLFSLSVRISESLPHPVRIPSHHAFIRGFPLVGCRIARPSSGVSSRLRELIGRLLLG